MGQSCCQELWRVEILLKVQVNKHSSWTRTKDTKLLGPRQRTIYLFIAIAVAWMSISICSSSRSPNSHRTRQGSVGDAYICCGLYYRKGALSLGNLNLFFFLKLEFLIKGSMCPLSQRETLSLLYRTVNKLLPFKAVCYVHVLEKIV